MFFTCCWPASTKFHAELVADLLPHRAGDGDAARRRDRLQARGDVDAVARNVLPVDQDVAEVDPDAVVDAPLGRQAAVAAGHLALDLDRRLQRRRARWGTPRACRRRPCARCARRGEAPPDRSPRRGSAASARAFRPRRPPSAGCSRRRRRSAPPPAGASMTKSWPPRRRAVAPRHGVVGGPPSPVPRCAGQSSEAQPRRRGGRRALALSSRRGRTDRPCRGARRRDQRAGARARLAAGALAADGSRSAVRGARRDRHLPAAAADHAADAAGGGLLRPLVAPLPRLADREPHLRPADPRVGKAPLDPAADQAHRDRADVGDAGGVDRLLRRAALAEGAAGLLRVALAIWMYRIPSREA